MADTRSATAPPVCGPTLLLCDRQDLDLIGDHSVDDAVRKAIEQVPLRTEEARPALRCFDDLRDRFVHREDELPAETAPALLVEPRAKAEVEDGLLMDAVGLLTFRHGARRGSRPW